MKNLKSYNPVSMSIADILRNRRAKKIKRLIIFYTKLAMHRYLQQNF